MVCHGVSVGAETLAGVYAVAYPNSRPRSVRLCRFIPPISLWLVPYNEEVHMVGAAWLFAGGDTLGARALSSKSDDGRV